MVNNLRLILMFIPAGLLCGCVERKLTVVTVPAEATVWLNDEEIGQSPVSVNFNWYGDYRVRIEKPGYEILTTHRNPARPMYDYFPMDFFAEVLWPGRIRDYYTWSFQLETAKTVPSGELIKGAQEMRDALDAEAQAGGPQSK